MRDQRNAKTDKEDHKDRMIKGKCLCRKRLCGNKEIKTYIFHKPARAFGIFTVLRILVTKPTANKTDDQCAGAVTKAKSQDLKCAKDNGYRQSRENEGNIGNVADLLDIADLLCKLDDRAIDSRNL